jgi:dsRNA-specific ribonuclease
MTSVSEKTERIYNPWNDVNRVIPDHIILSTLKKYGISEIPNNMDLFRQACVHRSYVDRLENRMSESGSKSEEVIVAPRPDGCLPLCKVDNEMIEFIGDSLLGSTIALYLFERYPDEDEGFLTKMKIRLVNNKSLGELATKMGFKKWLIVSRHIEEVCNGRNNVRILGSMLEAWIGAIYLDSMKTNPLTAFSRVQKWLVSLFETEIDFTQIIYENNNFKDQLLQYYQAHYHTPPKYKQISAIGPIHDRVYTMGVLDMKGDVIASAISKHKKMAEQEASKLALAILTKSDSE